MKRLYYALLAGILSFSLLACGSETPNGGSNSRSSATPIPDEQQSEDRSEDQSDEQFADENDQDNEQENEPQEKDLLPFLVFYSVTHMEFVGNGNLVIEEEEYNGTGEPGYDYFEWNNNDGSGGWVGVSIDATSTLIGDDQKIDEGEMIVDFHSYAVDLGCSYGTYILNGVLKCTSEITINTETDDWQSVQECKTDRDLLTVTSLENLTYSADVDVLIMGTGNGSTTESLNISGNYFWNGASVDLDELADEADEEECVSS